MNINKDREYALIEKNTLVKYCFKSLPNYYAEYAKKVKEIKNEKRTK